MMIHEITEKVGRHKKRTRVGRGQGSGKGKTAGRGHKGAGSRSGFGGSIHAANEGGQMPLFRRLRKLGFSNAMFRRDFEIVNLKAIATRFDDGAEVNAEILVKVGLIRDSKKPLKVLGEGDLVKKFNVTASAFSKSAQEKIVNAGGTATVAQ